MVFFYFLKYPLIGIGIVPVMHREYPLTSYLEVKGLKRIGIAMRSPPTCEGIRVRILCKDSLGRVGESTRVGESIVHAVRD